MKKAKKTAPPPPDCPICGRPASGHCRLPGCLIFECLACDVWGGRDADWHPRSSGDAA